MELGKIGMIDLSNNRSTFIHQNRSVSPRGSNCNSVGMYSQLGAFQNVANAGQAFEEVIKLKKELRLKQAEFDKEKALLLQKTSQLESQLDETQTRLTSQASMYESMINSLKQTDPANSTLMNKLHASEKQAYEEEISELKDYRRKLQDDMTQKEHEHLRVVNEREQAVKEMQLHIEKMLIDQSQSVFKWEMERKDWQARISKAQAEREQSEAMIDLKYNSKINEITMEMEKQKLEHMVEVEKIKGEYENTIKDIRIMHEQEKQSLEGRLDRQSHDLRSLHKMVVQQDSATMDSQENTMHHRQQLSMEIGTIQAEVDNIKAQFDQTVAELTKEKELAEQRNDKLQKQLEKLKNAPKQPTTLKIDLPFRPSDPNAPTEETVSSMQRQLKNLKEEVTLLQSENEKLTDQAKRLRKEAQEMHEYVEKLEANEKKFRQVLNDQAMIEQDQVVELRRQLNMEKKRALEQTELMSQVKEKLESENHKQQTHIMEKEDMIRNLTKELRSQEKKMYDIQSMFNGGIGVSNSLNMSGMMGGLGPMGDHMHHRGASQQFAHLGGLNNLPFIAQSQGNFSPQKFANQSMHIPQVSNHSFVAQMHPVEGTMMYQNQYRNDPQHQMMLRSIQRLGDYGAPQTNGPMIECPHCYLTFDSQIFNDHLAMEHPQFSQVNQSQTLIMNGGMPRAYSQTTLHTNPQQQYMRQALSQSVAASNKTHLINRRDEGMMQQQQNDISVLSQQNPMQNNQPLNRVPSFNQQYPLVQTSPRSTATTTMQGNQNMPGRFGPNSRSFTCLLNEIDEQEEQNLPPGSLPQSGKLARGCGMQINNINQNLLTNVDEDLDETVAHRESMAHKIYQKSRNTQGELNQLGLEGGSTVNYKAAMTTQNDVQETQMHREPSRESLSYKVEMAKRGSQTSREHHTQSIKSSVKDYSYDGEDKASSKNITNDIKDLLDKLVTLQQPAEGNKTVSSLSQNSHNSSNHHSSLGTQSNQIYTSKPNLHLASTDSLVELRSSASSNSVYIMGGDMKMNAQDFKPHATCKEMIFRSEKPSLVVNNDGVSSSVSNLQTLKKTQNKQATKQIPKANPGIPKQKSKTRAQKLKQTNDSVKAQQVIQDSSPALQYSGSSSHSNSPPSHDQETARHTSKDTLLTMNPKKHKNGRRYHEVNKSDVLTPNSPRRYQEYFKNKLQPSDMNGYSGQMTMIPKNLAKPATTAIEHANTIKQGVLQKQMTKTMNNQYNHRYSPSHTQSIANESQLSPSPEKGSGFGKTSNHMPLQNQLQNHQMFKIANNSNNPKQQQLFIGGSGSSKYDSGTVLCGGLSGPNSDYGFKPQNQQQVFPSGGAGFIIAGTFNNRVVLDNSMDDDGEIRPSQLDEFIEKKENKPDPITQQQPYAYGGPGQVTSSYISIGDDDLFTSSRFQDATTKVFNMKGPQNSSKTNNPSVLLQSERQMNSIPSNRSLNFSGVAKK